MTSSTLTSLAMLKVQVDHGHDYLDYLQPFILQVLIDHKINPVTDTEVRDCIRSDFGMEIPPRSIQVVLKRLSRNNLLRKENGVYRIIEKLPNPMIGTKKAEAERHINAILTGLREFAESIGKPISSDDEADVAVRAFLSQFDIQCLKAYLRGTTIPELKGHHNAQIVLVSKYVLGLQRNKPERFDSFLIVVQGHMLANALLCPDLQNVPKSYNGVTFYLDTPLLVCLLGLDGDAKKDSISELINLLISLGGSVGAFEHSRNELEGVIKGAANHIDSLDGRGAIVTEARRCGTTKSDMLLLSGQIDEKLKESKVIVVPTPRYVANFQIDETMFAKILDEEIRYWNRGAIKYDINSVRSIYVLRAHLSPQNIEKCKAVLVTSNTAFARAAFKYGGKHQESREVSTIITDFSLANMAWLKAPFGAPSIPMRETLAFSYAALQPSQAIWNKYLSEIEKLEEQQTITAVNLQLLRSSQLAQEELMNLTLGEEESLSEQTITEVLSRVTEEIQRDGNEKLVSEKKAHAKTRTDLEKARNEKSNIQKCLYWRCYRWASHFTWIVTVGLFVMLVVGLAASLGFNFDNQFIKWATPLAFGVLFLLTLSNLIWGTTVKNYHQALHSRFLSFLLTREATALGEKIFPVEHQGD